MSDLKNEIVEKLATVQRRSQGIDDHKGDLDLDVVAAEILQMLGARPGGEQLEVKYAFSSAEVTCATYAAAAEQIVDIYAIISRQTGKNYEVSSLVKDIIASLMHFCDAKDQCFEALLYCARRFYVQEVQQEKVLAGEQEGDDA